jgi:hypothetical protein
MVVLINNKTQKEYPIRDTDKNSAKEQAENIMRKYPGVFTLKTVRNPKSKEILKKAEDKEKE